MLFLANRDQNLHAWGELFVQLAPLIVVVGLLGIVMIVGLLVAWRRSQDRERSRESTHPGAGLSAMHPDIWSTAAQRIEPVRAGSPRPSPEEPPFDEDDYDDDEEDEDNEPWRESLGDIPDFGNADDDDDDGPDEDWGTDDEQDDWPRPT